MRTEVLSWFRSRPSPISQDVDSTIAGMKRHRSHSIAKPHQQLRLAPSATRHRRGFTVSIVVHWLICPVLAERFAWSSAFGGSFALSRGALVGSLPRDLLDSPGPTLGLPIDSAGPMKQSALPLADQRQLLSRSTTIILRAQVGRGWASCFNQIGLRPRVKANLIETTRGRVTSIV
jgi:hypothetical protein